MTPLERLLAESIPDGSFGGNRTMPREGPQAAVRRPITVEVDPEAAEHSRTLLEALSGFEWHDHETDYARPRLRVIPGEAA